MKKIKAPSFKDFLKVFPEVELPIALSEDDHHTFSNKNKTLSESMVEEFIRPREMDEIDEFTEYVPCFRLPHHDNYIAIVYWRAKLMDYHYMMQTYTQKGEFIQSIHIAGMRTDGEKIAQLFCHIKENRTIHLVAGSAEADSTKYDPASSKAFKITLNHDGTSEIEMDETLTE